MGKNSVNFLPNPGQGYVKNPVNDGIFYCFMLAKYSVWYGIMRVKNNNYIPRHWMVHEL